MAQFRQISIKIADDDAHAVFVEGAGWQGAHCHDLCQRKADEKHA